MVNIENKLYFLRSICGISPRVVHITPAQQAYFWNVKFVCLYTVCLFNIYLSTGVATVAGVSVAGTSSSPRRVSAPLVHLAPAALGHKQVVQQSSQGLVVAPSLHHVNPNKLKVLHAHSLTHTQRTQLLTHNRTIGQLPTVVSLATLADGKTTNAALLKAAPGSVAQLFEIKSGQLGKGPHLVNVVRQPQPGKTTVARLDLNDKKRQVVATFDGTLKGNIATTTRPHRVSLSLDGRQIVRTGVPSVRAPQIRNQIQLKNRTFQVTPQIARSSTDPSSSITISAPTKTASMPSSVVGNLSSTKTASIPSSVVANLLHKNVNLPKSGQKIAISGPGGQALSANVQAIAFTAAQLKARQARLVAQPRATPVAWVLLLYFFDVGKTVQAVLELRRFDLRYFKLCWTMFLHYCSSIRQLFRFLATKFVQPFSVSKICRIEQ